MTLSEQKEELKTFLLSSQNTGYCNEKWFKNHYTELYNDFLTWNFPADFKFNQKLYHYLNDDKELKLGHCIVCGKRCSFKNFKHGYPQHCSFKCAGKDKERVEKMKQTCLEKYGVDNPFKDEAIKEKIKQTNLEKYGVENYAQTDDFKEKAKQTNLEKYGAESYTQTDDFKENFKNSDWVSSIQEKSYQTKKKNHSFNSSKIEKEFADWLVKNNFKFERQYRSEEYPFNCDFYLNDYNLYIEIQGNWNRGEHPYNIEDENDNKVLVDWIKKSIEHPYYLNAIDVWTKRDVKKREIAKKNNLNYLEIFSCNLDEVATSINNYIFSLGAYGRE